MCLDSEEEKNGVSPISYFSHGYRSDICDVIIILPTCVGDSISSYARISARHIKQLV